MPLRFVFSALSLKKKNNNNLLLKKQGFSVTKYLNILI